MTKKNLAIFLDGTWNDPGDKTHVSIARDLINSTDGTDKQHIYYDEGVGSQNFEFFTGGVFGAGLGENIRQAYAWLMENYDDGDDVYIFGFSRGAYTATSLAGMNMQCGLLHKTAPLSVDWVFDRYERWPEERDQYRALYTLQAEKKKGRTDFTDEEDLLLKHSRRIKIKFIGIWDSVATVGIPIGNFRKISKEALEFHQPRHSILYENLAHALAIDEHRKQFNPVLIHDYIPTTESRIETRLKAAELANRIEQRWFCGSHGNVGGGYDDTLAAQLPLAWIMSKAQSFGLHLKNSAPTSGLEHTGALADSYQQFLHGVYAWIPFTRRFYRPIGQGAQKVKGGKIMTVNEVIDASVFKRWQNDPSYRPESLIRWAKNNRHDINKLEGETQARSRTS